MMKNEIFRVRYSWKNKFFKPVLMIVLFFAVYFFANSGEIFFPKSFIISIIVILIIYYLLFTQYEISNIILDETNNLFIVEYPASFLLKKREYRISNIERVHFKHSPGPYGTPKYYIWTKNNEKFKHYIPDNIEELTRRLEGMNIIVEID